MGRMIRPALIGILTLTLVACLAGCTARQTASPGKAPVAVIKDTDITELLVGKTFYGRYPNGSRWSEYVSKGGDSAYREDRKTCAGHWNVSGNIACFTYASYKNGEPNCFNVWQSDGKLLFVPLESDPTSDYVVVVDRIVDGDSESLMADRGTCK